MTRNPRALTKQMERLIESTLMPGHYISHHADLSFVEELGVVERQLAGLISTDPAQAVSLYETFLAGCYEKAGEIDGSSGRFGQFVGELHCGWIKARQAAGANPDETAARLLGWMEDDPYGFCYRLEEDAAKAFNRVGLAAFVKQIRARFDAAATITPRPGEPVGLSPDSVRRRWGEVLRPLYLRRKNVAAYLALAETMGLTAEDCRALASMLAARRKAEEALSWVERGIALAKQAPHGSMAAYDLAALQRVLLVKLGREKEALDAAWAQYREHPSRYSYDDLMKYVPRGERQAWHQKAIEAATGADLHALIELLLETKELERLAEAVGQRTDHALENVSHFATGSAAQKLEKTHPGVAARLWCAQGMRIINAKKSKYYDAAVSNFERARRCFERAGGMADWQRVVEKVRTEHRRKTGFMSEFERVVAGPPSIEKPSFLERAKKRWGRRV